MPIPMKSEFNSQSEVAVCVESAGAGNTPMISARHHSKSDRLLQMAPVKNASSSPSNRPAVSTMTHAVTAGARIPPPVGAKAESGSKTAHKNDARLPRTSAPIQQTEQPLPRVFTNPTIVRTRSNV